MIASAIVVICYAITAIFLICYRKKGAHHRAGISFLAYILITCSGAMVIDVLCNHATVRPWSSGIAFVVMILTVRARGNVARIITMGEDKPHYTPKQ